MKSIKASTIKYLNTRNGVAFAADLMEGGNKIGTVENDGNGGATEAFAIGGGFMRDLSESALDALMDEAEGVGV